jgi:hypothetical protein
MPLDCHVIVLPPLYALAIFWWVTLMVVAATLGAPHMPPVRDPWAWSDRVVLGVVARIWLRKMDGITTASSTLSFCACGSSIACWAIGWWFVISFDLCCAARGHNYYVLDASVCPNTCQSLRCCAKLWEKMKCDGLRCVIANHNETITEAAINMSGRLLHWKRWQSEPSSISTPTSWTGYSL